MPDRGITVIKVWMIATTLLTNANSHTPLDCFSADIGQVTLQPSSLSSPLPLSLAPSSLQFESILPDSPAPPMYIPISSYSSRYFNLSAVSKSYKLSDSLDSSSSGAPSKSTSSSLLTPLPFSSHSSTSPKNLSLPEPSYPPKATPSSSSFLTPSSSSSSSSYSSSSSVCWNQRVSLASDQKGNLWVLTSVKRQFEEVPGQVWVVSGSGSWRSVGGVAPDPHHPGVEGPLAVCAGRNGLRALYPREEGAPRVWLLSHADLTWRMLPDPSTSTQARGSLANHSSLPHSISPYPQATAPVLAHWCAPTATFLLLGPRKGDARQGHQLWTLKEQGGWSSVGVSELAGRNTRILLTWGRGEQGDLYLLQAGTGGLRVVRVEADTGAWSSVRLGPRPSGLWIPGAPPLLHLVHTVPQGHGLALTTLDHTTGATMASRPLALTDSTLPLLAIVNSTMVSSIPICMSHSPSLPPSSTTPNHPTIPILKLRLSCSSSAPITKGTMVVDMGEARRPPGLDHSHTHTVVADGKMVGAASPPMLDRTRVHTYNSVIFFSLSLSIFGLVGVILFVRNCVRCPPTREIGEGRDGDPHGPSSPLPVMYSIVSEDGNYDTSGNSSPCPSQNALYDATIMSAVDTPSGVTTPDYGTTPNGETPYYMTPDSMTPGSLSPTTGISRHTLVPSSFSSDPITRAIAGTTAHAISIATSPAFARRLNPNAATSLPDNSTTQL